MYVRVFGALLLVLSCLIVPIGRGQGASADELRALREEMTRVLKAQNDYMANEQKARTESYQRLSREMEAYTEAIRQVQTDLAAARKEVQTLRQENADLKRQIVARDEDLAARITAETAARAAADKQLGDAVTKQLEGVVRQVNSSVNGAVSAANEAAQAADAAARARASTPPPSGGAGGGGKYFIYEVAKGDTLSGIAGAADVSVADIKTMNNLTSDNIRIGQKLKIPQK